MIKKGKKGTTFVTMLLHVTFINRSTETAPVTGAEENTLSRIFSEKSSAHADDVNLSIRPWKKPGWHSLCGLKRQPIVFKRCVDSISQQGTGTPIVKLKSEL